jgi:hypothetical protein
MSIASYYDKTVSTQRLTNVGGASKRQRFQQVNASVSCTIHPLSPDEAVLGGSAFYQTFKLFCAPTVDVEIGDRIIDGAENYTVQGKQTYNDLGGSANEHIKLIIVKGK